MPKALPILMSCLVVLNALGPGATAAWAQSVAGAIGSPITLGQTALAGAAAPAFSPAGSPTTGLALASSILRPATLATGTSVRRRATAGEGRLSLTSLANAEGELSRGAEPDLTLASLFVAARQAAPASEPVARASPMGSPDGSGLDRWSNRSPGGWVPTPGPGSQESIFRRAGAWVRGLPKEAKIGASVALVVALLIGGFYLNASALNEFWQQSKSAAEVSLIDTARQNSDAAKLETIAKTARDRGDRMAARIVEAEKAKAKRVEDRTNDTVKEARRYLAFDRVVETRAELNGNAVSRDPGKRIGATTPGRWRETVAAHESEAKETGFEGRLALILRNLNGEITAEETKAGELRRHVDGFGQVSPSLFGGAMKAQHEKGTADLAEFHAAEIGPERALHSASVGAMRGRVSDRLYAEREDFKTHRDRGDRLASTYDRALSPALASAREVDSELGSMISHRNSETAMLALAAMHTSDAVTVNDGDGKSHTEYVDNSGPYRLLAAAEASAAQAAGRRANAALERLRPQLMALQGDATIKAEGLQRSLPHGAGSGVSGGHSFIVDVFLPPLFTMFAGLNSSSSGERARREFAPILSSLESVGQAVASRRDGERRWVDQRIDQDLAEQMSRVALPAEALER